MQIRDHLEDEKRQKIDIFRHFEIFEFSDFFVDLFFSHEIRHTYRTEGTLSMSNQWSMLVLYF
jgi:hypothetical protein